MATGSTSHIRQGDHTTGAEGRRQPRMRRFVTIGHCARLNLDMLHDLRRALRMLRRGPGFSILAILCLKLGIGATTSVFSWIEGILLRPFPLVQNQDRLAAAGRIPKASFCGVYSGSPERSFFGPASRPRTAVIRLRDSRRLPLAYRSS